MDGVDFRAKGANVLELWIVMQLYEGMGKVHVFLY